MIRWPRIASVLMLALLPAFTIQPAHAQGPDLRFDHNHTFSEVVDYLEAVTAAYPDIARIHTIGKSYQDRDLLVLEITNQATGDGLTKPGYWMDGTLHAGEVMGAEVCLKNIDTLVKGYGNDGESGEEGAVVHNAFGTYLHGSLLPKNPALADELLTRLNRLASN